MTSKGRAAVPGMGTLLNMITVLIGGIIGLIVGHRLPRSVTDIAMQAVGGVTVLIGVQMGLAADTGHYMIAVLVSLALGSMIGEALRLETRLENWGRSLQTRFSNKANSNHFTKAFVSTSLLFCVGPMTVLGAIQDGLFHDPTILYTKATLDGISAVAFAASLGFGTLFSVMTVFVVQGSLTVLAASMQHIMTPDVMTLLTATGGVMIIAIGMNIWQAAKLRVGNMVPSLVVAGLIGYFLF